MGVGSTPQNWPDLLKTPMTLKTGARGLLQVQEDHRDVTGFTFNVQL